MKRGILALLLAAVLILSGCSAMLNQTYIRVAPAEERLSTGDDPSVIEVGDRSALTSAVLSLVRQRAEHGVIRLKNYRGDVEADLSAACLEVAQEDPLGSFAVEGIRHDCSHIISYYEANLYITYRRTPEQVAGLVRVTGSGAIRTELSGALSAFSPEALLQVSYFAEDEEYIRTLAQQAYYGSPATALGMPGLTINLYPAQPHGYQRIVELQLTYPDSPEILRQKSEQLLEAAQALTEPLMEEPGDRALEELFTLLHRRALPVEEEVPVPEEETGAVPERTGVCATAWHALVEGQADSEGLALALTLMCQQLNLECTVVTGTRDGQNHAWNIVRLENGEYRHIDASQADGLFRSDADMVAASYSWNRGTGGLPLCGEQPPEEEPEVAPGPDGEPEAENPEEEGVN